LDYIWHFAFSIFRDEQTSEVQTGKDAIGSLASSRCPFTLPVSNSCCLTEEADMFGVAMPQTA